jgi:hypothetical protein
MYFHKNYSKVEYKFCFKILEIYPIGKVFCIGSVCKWGEFTLIRDSPVHSVVNIELQLNIMFV